MPRSPKTVTRHASWQNAATGVLSREGLAPLLIQIGENEVMLSGGSG